MKTLRDKILITSLLFLGFISVRSITNNSNNYYENFLEKASKIQPPNTNPSTLTQSIWKVETGISSGSAFTIHPYGYLLTNRHVTDNATDNTVTISSADGRYTQSARIISVNECDDLAILKITDSIGQKFPYLKLTDTGIFGGQRVTLFGFPFGNYDSDTGRIKKTDENAVFNESGVSTSFTTSAYLGSGSSGGPILNSNNEVVGVNVTAGIDGVQPQFDRFGRIRGFDVNRVQSGIDVYRNKSDIDRMFTDNFINGLGFRSLYYPDQDILEVRLVYPGSPAEKAGLQQGDVVTHFNGRRLAGTFTTGRICSIGNSPNESISIIRNGREKTLSLEGHVETML